MRLVQKFGGTSLMDSERLQAAALRCVELVKKGWQVVTVVSAQGKTTDELLAAAQRVCPNPSPRELDAYLSVGEQMSAALLAMTLEAMGCPAVSLSGPQAGLMTDGTYGNARILGLKHDRIERELNTGKVVIVAGFQGINGTGDVTTLGRGGSDTTAVALAAFLGAKFCRIYTDVDGIYDKDPRKHPNAQWIPCLDYDQMLTMAREGAQVLHDRCVELGQMYRVPIEVLSSFRPGRSSWVTDAEEIQENCPQI